MLCTFPSPKPAFDTHEYHSDGRNSVTADTVTTSTQSSFVEVSVAPIAGTVQDVVLDTHTTPSLVGALPVELPAVSAEAALATKCA